MTKSEARQYHLHAPSARYPTPMAERRAPIRPGQQLDHFRQLNKLIPADTDETETLVSFTPVY